MRSLKICAQMVAFREERRIEASISQFDGFVDKMVVAISLKPWYSSQLPDRTLQIAKRLEKKFKWLTVISGKWRKEHLQRNACTRRLKNCDWMIIAPPDRLFTKETLTVLPLFLADQKKRPFAMHTVDYWKNFNTAIYPMKTLNQAVVPLVDVYNRPWEFTYANTNNRWATGNPTVPGIAHHISWVKTDKEVLSKIKSYMHAPHIIKKWYENVWLRWTPRMTNFAPTEEYPSSGGISYKKAVKYKLPDELKKLYNKFVK